MVTAIAMPPAAGGQEAAPERAQSAGIEAALRAADPAPAAAPGAAPRPAAAADPDDADYAMVEEPVLHVGDEIEVVVFEDASFNGTYRIRGGGYVALPQIGRLRVAGMTPSEIEAMLKRLLEKKFLRTATVSVLPATALDEGRGVVYVIGEVDFPFERERRSHGVPIPPGKTLTILTAIIRAGGLNKHADPTKIQLARKEGERRKIYEMNYDAVLAGYEQGTELPLQPGDIVNVVGREGIDLDKAPPPSSGTVYLSGQVKSPGPHDIEDLTVYKTILRNGGFDRFANKKKVYVLREDDGKQIRIPVNVRAIVEQGALDLDIPVKDGDIIVVPEKFFSF